MGLGENHSCGVTADAGILCWGENLDGQGDVPEDSYIQVTAGRKHTCGLTSDQRIVCWGSNDEGQCDVPE